MIGNPKRPSLSCPPTSRRDRGGGWPDRAAPGSSGSEWPRSGRRRCGSCPTAERCGSSCAFILRDVLQHLGALAPVLFVLIQALQVVIAPIPGEVTGFLGGYLFGEMLGFIYSMIGLTAGSLFAFTVARWLGAPFVRRVVTTQMWERVDFLVKAEGAILCFIVFLIPGLPKDIACYLFGLSPIPFGVFAVVSTFGRVPGTWALSAEGAKTATGQYVELAVLTAVVIALALPLYYFRDRIVSRFHGTRRAR
jgi:uncharacterized membrane protein YdjX (TVP38/TMEM64 family)